MSLFRTAPPAGAAALCLQQAKAWAERGGHEQSLAACDAALRLQRDLPEALFLRAMALLGLRQWQPARTAFATLLRHDPRHAAGQFQLACLLEALGDTAAAADAFLAAARLDPGRALAWEGAARQLYRLDRLPEAEAAQARGAALDPTLWADGRIGHAIARRARDPASSGAAAAQCRAGPGAPDAAALLAAVDERELLVIDDFLPEPMAWRDQALTLPFAQPRDASVNYPGVQTLGQAVDPSWTQAMADGLGRDLKWGWPGHGAFRLSPAGSLARSDIHSDLDQGIAYAGVLYLSLPAHCQGGTSFWRQRATGWTRRPDAAQLAASPWGDLAGFTRSMSSDAGEGSEHQKLSAMRKDWELLFEVPMRFNRLIVYRSDFFHAVSQVFGQHAQDARLVQLFFFEPIGRVTVPT